MANTLNALRNGAVGFINWLDGLRRITHSLDELWLDPNGVMTVIWRLRAVIQDVQLEMAVFPKAVNPEGLADDALNNSGVPMPAASFKSDGICTTLTKSPIRS